MTNVPAEVVKVLPLSPGQAGLALAEPVNVGEAADDDDTRVETAPEDDAAEEEVAPEAVELAIEASLAPQTPLLGLGAPRPFFK